MKKFFFLFTGSLCVLIGVIGIFVPLLPTVPFLLLAAYLYAKGSERFYFWLIHHKWLGTILTNYKEGKGVPVRIRMYSVLFLWLTIGASIVFIIEDTTAKIIMLIVASGITLRLMLLKSKE